MIDEIFKVMKCFHDSFINSFGELIISVKGNVFLLLLIVKRKKMLFANYWNGVQDQWQKVSHMPAKKETRNGEIHSYMDLIFISERVLHKTICIGYMTNSETE